MKKPEIFEDIWMLLLGLACIVAASLLAAIAFS